MRKVKLSNKFKMRITNGQRKKLAMNINWSELMSILVQQMLAIIGHSSILVEESQNQMKMIPTGVKLKMIHGWNSMIHKLRNITSKNLKMTAMVEMVNQEVMVIHGLSEEATVKAHICLFMRKDKKDQSRY